MQFFFFICLLFSLYLLYSVCIYCICNWTSPPFICPRCKSSIPAITSSSDPVDAMPRVCGKQRKATVNDTNPSIEFLNATIGTLKSTLATKGLEIKKLKESNEIKAKRFANLETQLDVARKSIVSHQCTSATDFETSEKEKEY